MDVQVTSNSIAAMLNFQTFPFWLNIILFILAGVTVWISGTRLTAYADIISDRKNWDKASMGFIFLALATQLPEMATNTYTIIMSTMNILVCVVSHRLI